MLLSCSRVDERRCSLEGKTRTEAEEKRYSQVKKKDFCEAMRHLEAGGHAAILSIPHLLTFGIFSRK
jgi:hypothetical protein